MYEMTIDQPNRPKNDPIQIPGLGTFANGGTYTIDDEAAQSFRSYHSRQTTVVDEKTEAVKGTKAELGPTLLEASKNMYGVEVTVAKEQKSDNKSNDANKGAEEDKNKGGDSK